MIKVLLNCKYVPNIYLFIKNRVQSFRIFVDRGIDEQTKV